MLRQEAARGKWALTAGIVLAVCYAMFAGNHGHLAQADEPPSEFINPFDPKNWPKDPPIATRQVELPWQVWGQFDGREARISGVVAVPPAEDSTGEYTSTLPPMELRSGRQAIEKALRQPISLELQDAPLDEVARFLQKLTGVPIVLDRRALEEVLGIDASQTLTTLQVSDISVRSALRTILSQRELDYTVARDFSMVTIEPKAGGRLFTRAYPVADLVVRREPSGAKVADFDTLEKLITVCVSPVWGAALNSPGGLSGSLSHHEGSLSLVAATNGHGHAEIGSLLAGLREAARQLARGSWTPVPLTERVPSEKKIRAALRRKVTLRCEDEPLDRLVEQLAKQHGINIVFDRLDLKEVLGIVPGEQMITCDLPEMSLGSALKFVLRQIESTYRIENECLFITTQEKSDQILSPWLYPVGDLTAGPQGSERRRRELGMLEELIAGIVWPESWDRVGGPGTTMTVPLAGMTAIFAWHTQDTHEEIGEFFTALRRAVRQSAQGDMTPVPLDLDSPTQKKLLKALDQEITLHLENTPLEEVVRHLSKLTGVTFVLDRAEIKQVLGIGPDESISIDVTDVPLRLVLRQILSQLELMWWIEDEYILITTCEKADQILSVTFYPADDLVSGVDRSGRDLDELAELISTVDSPWSWEEVGGPGDLAPARIAGTNLILVRQTADVHEEIAEFFGLLRRGVRQLAAGKAPSPICLSPEEEKLHRVLRRKVTLYFENEPLEAVARQLEKTTGIGVELDVLEIKHVLNLGPDVPVSIDVTDVPLGRALDRMLFPREMTWVIGGNYILITTDDKADQMLSIWLYPVGDLVEPREHVRRADWNFDSLCNILTGSVCPHTWEEVGGPGTLMPTQVGGLRALVARQTRKVHEEMAAALAALRKAARQSAQGSLTPVQLTPDAHGEKKILEQLRRNVTIDIQKEPLQATIEKLRAVSGIDIIVDYTETRAVLGIDPDDPVSIACVDQSLGSALRRSLHPLDLTWIIEDERLVITTREKAERALVYWLHPVRDLVTLSRAVDPADYDFNSLEVLIMITVPPESWPDGSGPGPIGHVELAGMAAFLVPQNREVQEEIAALLTALRRAVRQSDRGDMTPVLLTGLSRPARESDQMLEMQIYPVEDLIHLHDPPKTLDDALGSLEKVIMATGQPKSWEEDVGGWGSASPIVLDGMPAMLVRQTAEVHDEIAVLLDKLRAAGEK